MTILRNFVNQKVKVVLATATAAILGTSFAFGQDAPVVDSSTTTTTVTTSTSTGEASPADQLVSMNASLKEAEESLGVAQAELDKIKAANQPTVDAAKIALDHATKNSDNAKANLDLSNLLVESVKQLGDKDTDGKLAADADKNNDQAKNNVEDANKTLTDTQTWYDTAIAPINDAQTSVDTVQKEINSIKQSIEAAKAQ